MCSHTFMDNVGGWNNCPGYFVVFLFVLLFASLRSSSIHTYKTSKMKCGGGYANVSWRDFDATRESWCRIKRYTWNTWRRKKKKNIRKCARYLVTSNLNINLIVRQTWLTALKNLSLCYRKYKIKYMYI